jgi:signal transduction histidine kinase
MLGRDREVVLAAVFLAMASYELLEMWTLELPRAPLLSLGLLVHAIQVGAILAATAVVLGAWREKSRSEAALARMVEQVLVADEQARRRIAYDLHDGVAPLIVSAKQHVDTSREVWSRAPERAAAESGKAADRLQRAIVEIRRVLSGLGPAPVASIGLVDALRASLTETAEQAGWSVALTENVGDARLSPALEAALFWIFQEAMTNVARHAQAPRMDVRLARDAEWLTLEVRDSGVGFAPPEDGERAGGLGLISMRERARLLGGICQVRSEPGRGTCVEVRLPLAHGANGHRR